jgi:hypothetical protein
MTAYHAKYFVHELTKRCPSDNHGSNMKVYDHLLEKAVDSLAATFRKRAASGLQSGRGFVLPNAQEQIHEKTDLELITWLVIKKEEHE